MFLRPAVAVLAAGAALAFAGAASTATAGAAVEAKEVFLENCAKCHGETGNADTDLGARYMAADFTSDKFHEEFKSEAKVKKVIQNGVHDTKMKAWKGILSDAEIDALAKYVIGLSNKK